MKTSLRLRWKPIWKQLRTRLQQACNLYEQVELLATIARRALDQPVYLAGKTVSTQELLEEVYAEAGRRRLWAVVRRASALLGKVDADWSDAVSAILVCQKNVLVGRAYSVDLLITQPLPTQELLNKINTFAAMIRESALTEELLIYVGLLIRRNRSFLPIC